MEGDENRGMEKRMKTTTGRYDGPANRAAARFAARFAVLLLVWPRAAAEARPAGQDDRQAQVDELARVLGMTAEEVEALGLSSAEVGVPLEGYTEETVVIGTRARPAAQARDGPFPGQHVSGKSRANPEATDIRETVVTRPWTDRLRAGAASIRAIHFLGVAHADRGTAGSGESAAVASAPIRC